MDLIKKLNPEIILMDINMPEMNGVEASARALEIKPNLNILVLSMYDDYSYYSKLVSIGVKGFITKSSGKNELESAITAVGNSECYFSSDLLRNILIEINKSQGKSMLPDNIEFTKRELEVLKLICNGFATNEIAEKLYLSNKTIDNHRSKLLQKTGVKNSVGLVIYAIKNKVVTI